MTDFLVKRFIKNSTDVNDPAVRTAYGNLAGAVGIFCNVLLCAAKLAVGTLFGSISITADAVNNLSDASSSVITLVGFRLSAKPRTTNTLTAMRASNIWRGWPSR